MTNIEIGAYDAKTRLPELIRAVQAGQRYTITVRGKPAADLIPSQSAPEVSAATAIERMRTFMRQAPAQNEYPVDIRALIDEGRD